MFRKINKFKIFRVYKLDKKIINNKNPQKQRKMMLMTKNKKMQVKSLTIYLRI